MSAKAIVSSAFLASATAMASMANAGPLTKEEGAAAAHGICLPIGGPQPLGRERVGHFCALVERYEHALVSERLAWSTHQSRFFNDLLPLPYTKTTLVQVCSHPFEVGEKIVTSDLEAEPILALLEDKYELVLVEAQYQLEAATADDGIAQLLGVEIGSPIFLIESTSYSEGLLPVDYENLDYRGDLIRFSTRLSRRPRPRT